MDRWTQIAGALAGMLLVLALCAGCASQRALSSSEIEKARSEGAAAAKVDWDCNVAVIYVFRQVAPGEHDAATGLPLQDGGSDAVSPARAAWVIGYNQAIQQYKTAEGSPRTIQRTGQLPWNSRYGICVATAVSGGEVVAARVVEYAQSGAKTAVPQSALQSKDTIAIMFDEQVGDAVGLARYEVSRSLIHRDGKVYVAMSGREVEVR